MIDTAIQKIILNICNNQQSDADIQTLEAFIQSADFNTVSAVADFYYANLQNQSTENQHYQILISKIEQKIEVFEVQNQPKKQTVFFNQKNKRVYAFAAILIGVVIGTFIFTRKEEKTTTLNTTISNKPIIQPGGKKAILVIENGTNILLDETKNGLLKTNSTANIQQNNHQLNYTANSHLTEQQFHTITTPNGGEYELVLADGTKVWLNAASSLRFPTNFTSNTRTVTLFGEAYFEVTPNKNKPFIVETGKSTIQVLGTNFNVMNYPNESAIKTTLLEGSVTVQYANQTAKLLPGNQAIIDKEKIETLPVDVEEVVAWKNGLFTFHKSDLKTIMKQLARWYDVEVSYVGNIPEKRFVGDIKRNSNLSEVLKILATSGIKFTVEGKKIIVTH